MASIKKQNQQKPRKNKLIFFILALAFIVRTYKLYSPLADWHSWRQVDTASVAVEYVKNGIDLLHPKYLDLSNIPSGKDNLEGYRMVEFPLVSGLVALVDNILPQDIEIHVLYRIFSIIFSLGSTYFLYKLVNLLESKKLAHISALIFALLPFNIFYSRSVLPEISLVFFSLLGMYSITAYFKSKNKSIYNPDFWTGAVSLSVALLIKPYALIFMLPLMYLGLKNTGIKLLKDAKTYLFLSIILTPLILWRFWIQQFPEGIPAFMWLLNGNNIRFKGAFFRWIFAERIGKLILGYWGIFLLGLGFLKKSKSAFFFWWMISILVYLFTFATGNVQHDYYQIILIPIISIYLAKGVVFLLEAPKKLKISRIKSYTLLTITSVFALAFSWYEIRGYFNINNPAIVEAGQFVDKNTPDDALIIAPYMGDTAFLYQTNRRGWPIGGEIDKRVEQGADYYVTTALDDEAKSLMDTYQIIESNDQFTLIKLIPQEADQVKGVSDEDIQEEKLETLPLPSPTPKAEKILWPPGKGVKKKK